MKHLEKSAVLDWNLTTTLEHAHLPHIRDIQTVSDDTLLPIDLDESQLFEPKDRLNGGARRVALTPTGLEQAVQLGLRLKDKYSMLYNQVWGLDAYTTKTRRTMMTLRGVLTGLLPEEDDFVVPVRVSESEHEWAVINTSAWCPEYVRQFKENLAHAFNKLEFKEILAHFNSFKLISPKRAHPHQIHVLRDQLVAGQTESMNLPAFVKAHHIHALEQAGLDHFTYVFGGRNEEDEFVRHMKMGIGRMIHRLLDPNQDTSPVFIYSAHDWTLLPLMMVLSKEFHFPVDELPTFASDICIERWKFGGVPMVRVLYKGDVLALSQETGFVEEADFRAKLSKYSFVAEEFEDLCGEVGEVQEGSSPFNKVIETEKPEVVDLTKQETR